MVRFTLSQRDEVLVVLRGPLPNCDVRAQRRIEAKRGANAVRLSQVIRPTRAVPGHYLLTVYVDSVPKVRKVVHILGNRAQLLGTAAIGEALALCTARSAALSPFVDGPDGASGSAPPAGAGAPQTNGAAIETLPPEGPRAEVLSFLDADGANILNPALAVVIGLALGALLLAGLGGMAAFVRGRTRSA